MTDNINRQILLVEKPTGKLALQNFKIVEGKIPKPKDGEVLLRVRYISLDAANRAWMHGATYRSAIETNTVMAGGAIAEVISSKAPGFAKGDLVFGDTGWQDYAAVSAKHLVKVPYLEPMTHLLSVFGIAGGKAKCDWLVSELGFDAAVDYKTEPVFKALKAAAPNGIDVYFDNVGGDILEACLPQMNLRGRIACCGAVSQYDGVPSATGPRGVPGLIVVKRLTMQGFIVMDFDDQREQALADLQSWVKSGKLKVQEDIIDGLENTPQALIGLLAGENRGKRMVKV
jgi:NADPH-dependent curcumin reductase CurA